MFKYISRNTIRLASIVIIAVLVGLPLVLGTSVSLVNAQTTPVGQPPTVQNKPAMDLTVFPPTAYLSVIPGKSISHRVLLQYTGAQPMQLTAEVRDFTADGTTGVPVIQDTTSFATVTMTSPEHKLGEPFVIRPNSRVDIVLQIQPAPDMLEKEYPLAIVLKVEPLPDSIGVDSGASAAGTIVSNMIVWVSMDGKNKGQITISDFPMPRFVDSFGKIKIAALAENTGETALAPKGSMVLYHWRGKKLGDWFIFPDVVLAKSTRLLRASSTDPATLRDGDKPNLVDMTYDAPFLIGPYTLTTQLEHTDGTTEQRTVTVFAFPFSIILAVLAGSGLYAGYLYISRHLSTKRW